MILYNYLSSPRKHFHISLYQTSDFLYINQILSPFEQLQLLQKQADIILQKVGLESCEELFDVAHLEVLVARVEEEEQFVDEDVRV